jgi:hypothetical protein
MIPNWLVWLDWLQLHRSYHGGQASPDSYQISGVGHPSGAHRPRPGRLWAAAEPQL